MEGPAPAVGKASRRPPTLRAAAREYIWLYDLRHGIAVPEIASRAGLSENTVRAGLRRARRLDGRRPPAEPPAWLDAAGPSRSPGLAAIPDRGPHSRLGLSASGGPAPLPVRLHDVRPGLVRRRTRPRRIGFPGRPDRADDHQAHRDATAAHHISTHRDRPMNWQAVKAAVVAFLIVHWELIPALTAAAVLVQPLEPHAVGRTVAIVVYGFFAAKWGAKNLLPAPKPAPKPAPDPAPKPAGG